MVTLNVIDFCNANEPSMNPRSKPGPNAKARLHAQSTKRTRARLQGCASPHHPSLPLFSQDCASEVS
jgi:hypothetical protein